MFVNLLPFKYRCNTTHWMLNNKSIVMVKHLIGFTQVENWQNWKLQMTSSYTLIIYDLLAFYPQYRTRGSAHWACIAHLTIEWYWSKFQREIIITLKNSSHLEEGGAVGHNFKRDTPRDHLCQVWLHLAKLFQRRRFFKH